VNYITLFPNCVTNTGSEHITFILYKKCFLLKLNIVMKNLVKLFSTSVAMLSLSVASFGQVSASATTTATIITPITIVKDLDMNFGNLYVSSILGGTLALSPGNIRTVTSGVGAPAAAGTVSAAAFTVNGMASTTYSITLPSVPTVISFGAANMSVDLFSSNPSTTGLLSAAGTQNILVGATLTVNAAQLPGVYVSTVPFDVTVNYN
jgi:hypothetical protein